MLTELDIINDMLRATGTFLLFCYWCALVVIELLMHIKNKKKTRTLIKGYGLS